ncbi:hypothetical protein ABH935_010047 [Catenulispora sp. GAS73]|uniref:hypothetical protein n=1 Tax=Catenulispora sp. GAS73 TaxID=3156269 RepID=UPI003519B418
MTTQDTVKATDVRVRKGRWIFRDMHPRGWSLITCRNPELYAEGRVHIAVNNRGTSCDVLLTPGTDVLIRSYAGGGLTENLFLEGASRTTFLTYPLEDLPWRHD